MVLVNVVLRKQIENQPEKQKRYYRAKLKTVSHTDKKKYLCIYSDKKLKESLLLTENVMKYHKTFVETQGIATIQFHNPRLDCHLKVNEVTVTNFHKLKHFLDNALSKKPVQQKYISNIGKEDARELSLLTQVKGGNWDSITTLDLTDRGLTTLPKAIGCLSLKRLILQGNKIMPNMEAWTWLVEPLISTLNHIDLRRNELTAVPAKLQRCWNLRSIDISSNQLSYVPSSLLDPAKPVVDLNVSQNPPLKYLPTLLKKLAMLTVSTEHPLVHPDVNFAPHDFIGTPSLLNLAFRAFMSNRKYPVVKLHCWLFNSPRQLPSTLRDYMDSYRLCYRCGKRVLDGYVTSTFVRGSEYATLFSGERQLINMERTFCYLCIPLTLRR